MVPIMQILGEFMQVTFEEAGSIQSSLGGMTCGVYA